MVNIEKEKLGFGPFNKNEADTIGLVVLHCGFGGRVDDYLAVSTNVELQLSSETVNVSILDRNSVVDVYLAYVFVPECHLNTS